MKRALLSASLLLLCLATATCALEESADTGSAARDSSPSRSTTTQAASEAGVIDTAPTAVSAICGDNVCTPSLEDCGTCLSDCPCWQAGTVCSGGQCIFPECDPSELCCRKPWLPICQLQATPN